MPTAVTQQNVQPVPLGPWRPIFVGVDFVVTGTELKPEQINDRIQRASFAISPAIESIISDSCSEEYSESGLKIGTGRLVLFGSHLFDLSIRAIGHIVRVRATWRNPPIPYARIHLFGSMGIGALPSTHGMSNYITWGDSHVDGKGRTRRTRMMNIPKRNYIRLSSGACAKIENIIRTVLGAEDRPDKPKQGNTPSASAIWSRIASIYANLLSANSYHAQRRMARYSMPQVEELLQQVGVSAFTAPHQEWNIQFARDVILVAVNKHKSMVSKIYGELDRAELSQDTLRWARYHAQEPYATQ